MPLTATVANQEDVNDNTFCSSKQRVCGCEVRLTALEERVVNIFAIISVTSEN